MPVQGQAPAMKPVKLFDWLHGLIRELDQKQRELHRQRHLRTILNACYHAGHQRISQLPNGEIIVSPPQNPDEPIMSHNHFRPYIRQVTASWMDSHPTFDILPITDNDRERRHARREMQRCSGYYERKWLGHDVREKTAVGAQLSGSYGYEVFWDESQPHAEEWKEEYEPYEIPGQGFIDCYACGEQSTVEGEPQRTCPKCGSEDVLLDAVEGVQGERLAKSGYEGAGDVIINLVQDAATHYDLTVGKAESPYLCVFDDRPKTELEYLYQQEINASGVGASNQDAVFHPLRFLRNVGNTFNLGGTNGATTNDGVLRRNRWFLEPQLYWNLVLEEDAQMPDGSTLKRGTAVIEAFPDGINAITVEGLDRFLSISNVSHRGRFVWGMYGELLGRFDGYGVEDAREGQRITNLLLSGVVTGTLRSLLGSTVVDTSVFRDAKLFNRPGGVIPLNRQEMTEFKRVQDHYDHVDAPPINQHAYALIQQMKAEMQANIGDQNSSGADAPGVDNPTATAAKIALAKSATAQNLHLLAYSACMKDTLTLALSLAQQNYKAKRRIAGDERNGATSYEITPDKLNYNFLMMVKTGTHYPNLHIEKQSKLLEASSALTALLTAGVSREQALRLTEESYSIDLDEQPADQVSEQGEETLEMMIDYLEQRRAALAEVQPVAPPPMGMEEEGYDVEDYPQPYDTMEDAAETQAGQLDAQGMPLQQGMQPQASPMPQSPQIPMVMDVTPEELYALRPVMPERLGHAMTLRFWREWLSSKEAEIADPVLIEAVRLHIQAEIAAIAQEKQIEAQVAMAGNPQMMMAQAQAASMPAQ